MRATVLSFFALATLAACPAPVTASCDNCPGCCTAAGACVPGTIAAACGSAGGACTECAGGTSCLLGLCVSPATNDGGSTDAGCITTGCATGQVCDRDHGACTVACPNGSDAECPQPGFCASGLCGCSPGTHLCGTACVPSASLATCGGSCTACPVPASGSATCDGLACGISCPSSLKPCGSTCATCPAGATSTACEGERCVAQTCGSALRLCSGACASCPPAAAVDCSGTSCVATACTSGQHVCSGACQSDTSLASCGARCSPCPQPTSHGSATCAAGQCGLNCNTGFTACGTECATCPATAGVATTTCAGNSCVASTCAAGFRLCGGVCATCPETAAATSCSAATCVATSCAAPFRLCGSSCCGLHTVKADALALNEPVGAAHLPDGTPVLAWNSTYYGYGLKVATPATDGGLLPTTAPGTGNAEGLSFASDSNGTQHLVYAVNVFNGNDSIGHAWRTGLGAWQTEAAWAPIPSGIFLDTAMGLTSAGDLRVVYSDNLAGKLFYLEKNGPTWTTPVEVPLPFQYRGFAVAVDALGRAHVLVPTSTGLQYAWGNTTTLVAGPTLGTTSTYGLEPALAIAPDGTVTVMWTQGTNLVLSTLQGAAWTTPVVIAPADSLATSMAFDGAGRIQVLFSGCGVSGCGARYGAQTSTGWVFQTLLNPGGYSFNASHVAIATTDAGVAAGVCATITDGVYVLLP